MMNEAEEIRVPIEHERVNHSQEIFNGKKKLRRVLAQQMIEACHVFAYIL